MVRQFQKFRYKIISMSCKQYIKILSRINCIYCLIICRKILVQLENQSHLIIVWGSVFTNQCFSFSPFFFFLFVFYETSPDIN